MYPGQWRFGSTPDDGNFVDTTWVENIFHTFYILCYFLLFFFKQGKDFLRHSHFNTFLRKRFDLKTNTHLLDKSERGKYLFSPKLFIILTVTGSE